MSAQQKENGFTPIANELVCQFAMTYMSSRESQIVWAIIRMTYGYQKKTDKISFTQLELLTGIDRRHLAPALRKLTERRIITRYSEGQSVIYGIQKDYDLWDKPLPESVTVNDSLTITETGNGLLPNPVTEPLPNSVNTKERKKSLNKSNYVFSLPDELKEVKGFGEKWNNRVVHVKEIKKLKNPVSVKGKINDLLNWSRAGFNIISTIVKSVEFPYVALCGTGLGTPFIFLDYDKYQLKQSKNKGFAVKDDYVNDEPDTEHGTTCAQPANNTKNDNKEKEYSLNSNEFRHSSLFYEFLQRRNPNNFRCLHINSSKLKAYNQSQRSGEGFRQANKSVMFPYVPGLKVNWNRGAPLAKSINEFNVLRINQVKSFQVCRNFLQTHLSALKAAEILQSSK